MPEMRFRVRWPDTTETDCYSPSLVVRDYLTVGQKYELEDFVARTRAALDIADERVFQKYGFHCTSARAQREEIERISLLQPPDTDAKVLVFEFRDS